MKKINIRGLATPLIIGAGIFVALTGLIMFFLTSDPFRFAHELVGLGFAVAIVLHIQSNWRPFKRYFRQTRPASIIAVAWLIGISLVMYSVTQPHEDVEEVVVERIEQTSIALLAPIVGVEVNELLERLNGDGYGVEDTEMSVAEVAETYNVDTEAILLSVFAEE